MATAFTFTAARFFASLKNDTRRWAFSTGSKKRTVRCVFCYYLFSFAELVFIYTTEGASEIFGKIFEFCAGLNAVFGGAELLIIFPSAYVAYIFHN